MEDLIIYIGNWDGVIDIKKRLREGESWGRVP
jgi:hypothetical protein